MFKNFPILPNFPSKLAEKLPNFVFFTLVVFTLKLLVKSHFNWGKNPSFENPFGDKTPVSKNEKKTLGVITMIQE